MILISIALKMATERLKAAGISDAQLDAKHLLAHILNTNPVGLSLQGNQYLDTDQLITFRQFIDRRVDREPVAKIIQGRWFFGHKFIVSSGTLDPRADSEALIDLALTLSPAKTVLDLGTGTGCLLLSYLIACDGSRGLGVDMSHEAICVASENAKALGVEQRACFFLSHWTNSISENQKFDLILSNPPYIREDEYGHLQPEVRRWDPPIALISGPDGLEAYRQIFASIPKICSPRANLCLEIGFGQGAQVRSLAASTGWTYLGNRHDLGGIERALAFSLT